jgi:glycerol-3-phosphate dehydrogenase
MKRELGRLTDREFDLIVVGGGIYGACAAWDATQRGLSVALIDRGDFCSATSAHSFKVVHGGIRYLQHADVFRIRQSSGERRALLRIAPHLVQPLPIAIPTYGHAMRGKELLRAGMTLYDLLTADRNRGIRDPGGRIPACRTWSRREMLDRFPGLEPAALTGGAIFCDGQMRNPPRLVLAFVRRAEVEGATVANHVGATGFVIEGDRVRGVRARDALTGVDLVIRARMVLNAAGPYAERLLATSLGRRLDPPGTYSRDACIVVKRSVVDHALAVQGATRDPDAMLSRGERHLFLVPWRAFTLVGVWHVVYGGEPDSFTVTEEEIQRWMDEMNAAYPAAALTLDDVSTWNAGLVPFGENEPGAGNLRYGHRSRLVDHAAAHGIHGLVTLIGIRYTTGRYDAARAIDLVFRRLGRSSPPCRTASTPVYGGEIDDVEATVREAEAAVQKAGAARGASGVPPNIARELVLAYGTAHRDVIELLSADPTLAQPIGNTSTIRAEIVYAVREEMAQTLADVLFRRTNLATGAHPGAAVVTSCAGLMARELGWSAARVAEEVDSVGAHLATGRALRG